MPVVCNGCLTDEYDKNSMFCVMIIAILLCQHRSQKYVMLLYNMKHDIVFFQVVITCFV